MKKESKVEKSKAMEKDIPKDLRNLVISRLEIVSPNKKFFIGSRREGFTKEELIEHVKKGDEIGQKVIEVEMTFLRALKDGILLEEVISSAS